MADRIDQVAERLNNLITAGKADFAARLDGPDGAEGPIAERALSNTALLLEALATFYRDPKSEFFPTVITAAIQDRLIQAENTFAGLPEIDQPIPAASALNLVKQLEELYAYCLQYGLITYGFTGKIAQEQIELIRRTRQQTEAATRKMLATVEAHESELDSSLTAFAKLMDNAESDLKSEAT